MASTFSSASVCRHFVWYICGVAALSVLLASFSSAEAARLISDPQLQAGLDPEGITRNRQPLVRPAASNERPIVGILSVPSSYEGCDTLPKPGSQAQVQAEDGEGTAKSSPISKRKPYDGFTTSCFHSMYVKWLEQAGARVVPLKYDASAEELKPILDSLNGILLTGGGAPLVDLSSPFMRTASFLLNYTLEANNNGEYFPMWGTCMGFQMLAILVANETSVLETNVYDSEYLMLPLNMTVEADTSRLFGLDAMPENIRSTLANKPVTTNLHHDGVEPSVFEASNNLNQFFKMLSTNVDRNGKPFASSIESRDYPIYGVQWHPERPQFQWSTTLPDKIGHTVEGLQAMQWLANFFVTETRRNDRNFTSIDAENQHLIYNYPPEGNTSYQSYVFLTDPRIALEEWEHSGFGYPTISQ